MSSIHVPVPSTVEPPSDAHPTGRRPFAVSVVQNTGGKLCKVLSYDPATGRVAAKADAFLREGLVREVAFESLSAFMSFRSTLPTDCALMMGKPLYPDARIVKLPYADHFIWRSNPDDVEREMNGFMDGLH